MSSVDVRVRATQSSTNVSFSVIDAAILVLFFFFLFVNCHHVFFYVSLSRGFHSIINAFSAKLSRKWKLFVLCHITHKFSSGIKPKQYTNGFIYEWNIQYSGLLGQLYLLLVFVAN